MLTISIGFEICHGTFVEQYVSVRVVAMNVTLSFIIQEQAHDALVTWEQVHSNTLLLTSVLIDLSIPSAILWAGVTVLIITISIEFEFFDFKVI